MNTEARLRWGILGELVTPAQLVKANSMMEGSTIVAILIGAVLGGLLADVSVTGALWFVAGCYVLAAVANLLIPRLPPARNFVHGAVAGSGRLSLVVLVADFVQALRRLLGDADARFSLLGTSVFWGAGSTLRLLLVAWVPVALHAADLGTPANLSGAVAIGIALGAVGAARYVGLHNVNRALPAGLLIGILIMAFAFVDSFAAAAFMLVAIGACGGFYVVPLNALLQTRGQATVGTGHAIAVQNFVENCCMLLMVGFYAMLERYEVPVISAAIAIGALVLAATSILAWRRRRG